MSRTVRLPVDNVAGAFSATWAFRNDNLSYQRHLQTYSSDVPCHFSSCSVVRLCLCTLTSDVSICWRPQDLQQLRTFEACEKMLPKNKL